MSATHAYLCMRCTDDQSATFPNKVLARSFTKIDWSNYLERLGATERVRVTNLSAPEGQANLSTDFVHPAMPKGLA